MFEVESIHRVQSGSQQEALQLNFDNVRRFLQKEGAAEMKLGVRPSSQGTGGSVPVAHSFFDWSLLSLSQVHTRWLFHGASPEAIACVAQDGFVPVASGL